MKVLELINLGAKELRLKKIDSSILDSELMLSKILNKKREEILINLDPIFIISKAFMNLGFQVSNFAPLI